SPATPHVVDLTGDGTADILLVDRQGEILIRAGRRGQDGIFEPPVVLNPAAAGGRPARSIAVVSTGAGARVAAVNLRDNSVSVYTVEIDPATGLPRGTLADLLVTDFVPARIVSGDLDGAFGNDLIVGNALFGTVSVFAAQADGSFGARRDLAAGITLSDVRLSDLDRDGDLDILATNQVSSELSVFRNRTSAPGQPLFAAELRYRAATQDLGTVLSGVSEIANSRSFRQAAKELLRGIAEEFVRAQLGSNINRLVPGSLDAALDEFEEYVEDNYNTLFPNVYFPVSRDGTTTLVVGDFNGDGLEDVITINRERDAFALLAGTGHGVLANAVSSEALLIADPGSSNPLDAPTAAVTDDFDGDGKLDLAILNDASDTIAVLLGNGDGTFQHRATLDAGGGPTGLSVRDIDGDGALDLLVGNQFGDVLTLLGNGDGTFQPFQRTGRSVPVAVADLDGDGTDEFILANEQLDRLIVKDDPDDAAGLFEQDRDDGLLAPAGVQVVDLNGDGLLDLVAANSGANSVLVYQGLGPAGFTPPKEFAVGTTPTGITVADLDGNGLLDLLVSNRGSNDVSVLFGAPAVAGAAAGTNTIEMTIGPRLDAGVDPVSTVLFDNDQDGIDDLLVTGAQSGQFQLLPGVGGGFFNDTSPLVLDGGLGSFATQGAVLVGNSLFAAAPFANAVAFIPDVRAAFQAGGGVQQIDTGGLNPVALTTADFNSDGAFDLIVANSGDGTVSLLASVGGGGFTLDSLLNDPGLVSPSALALLGGDDGLQIAVTDEGSEIVTVFDLVEGPDAPGGGNGIDPRSTPLEAALAAGGALNSLLLASLFTGVFDEDSLTTDEQRALLAAVVELFVEDYLSPVQQLVEGGSESLAPAIVDAIAAWVGLEISGELDERLRAVSDFLAEGARTSEVVRLLDALSLLARALGLVEVAPQDSTVPLPEPEAQDPGSPSAAAADAHSSQAAATSAAPGAVDAVPPEEADPTDAVMQAVLTDADFAGRLFDEDRAQPRWRTGDSGWNGTSATPAAQDTSRARAAEEAWGRRLWPLAVPAAALLLDRSPRKRERHRRGDSRRRSRRSMEAATTD
ncbi:MAG: VCBS repeat-containing protein, partial [Planctomycetes bacterium]|nr:VCBS repeat-containing protein [Planctomycetota bacterium]